MKILRLATFLDFGGVEKRLINVSSYREFNSEHVFVAINKGGVAEEAIIKNGKRVFCLQLPYKIPSSKAIVRLYYLIKEERPDVIHTSGAEANFHGIIAAWLAGVPVRIAEEIGIPGQSKLAKRIFGLVYNLTHAVIGNAQQVLMYLQQNNQVPSRKLKLVHNPVLFPELPATKKNNSFILLSVSRLEPIKNLEVVINLIPELLKVNPKLEYWIVGKGSMENQLQKQVVDLNLSGHVKFLGFKSNVIDYLVRADAFVLPSFSEGFSNALVEAMYAGLPCIATKVGGSSDIITAGRNGFLIDPIDKKNIFKVLSEVITSPRNELEEIGKRAKIHVESSYSLENHINQLLSIYEAHLSK